MTNRDIDEDFVHDCAIVQSDGETVANSSLRGIVIIQCDLRVFNAMHLRTEGVDSGIFRNIILVILRGQSSIDQWNRNLMSNYI